MKMMKKKSHDTDGKNISLSSVDIYARVSNKCNHFRIM